MDQKKIAKCKIEDIDSDRPKSEQVWCVYSEDGSKLLGRHPNREDAVNQLRAVEANKSEKISARLRRILEDKVRKHNENAKEGRKTNVRTLLAVYKRGVGAYRTNPSSVRPSVTSEEQWALARVNVWLDALRTGKFKRKPFDTDLLPEDHPLSSKKELDLKPTTGMAEEARKGLDWRKEFKRGGTAVGVARASQLVRRENLSPRTVKRMHSFFSRHEVDKKAEGFRQGEDGYPSAGRIAWALWGGDAGQSWARKKARQLDGDKMEEKAMADQYTSESGAEARAEELGCNGTHTMKDEDGNTVYMPCSTHSAYEEAVEEEKAYHYDDEDKPKRKKPKKDLGEIGTKQFDFQVKTLESEDTTINGVPVKSFEGYASVFGNIDRVGDMVMRGAFRKQDGDRVILMHNHRTNVGVADIVEDDKGLFVKGYINQEIQAGREGYSLLKMGAVNKMSFGYEVKGVRRSVKDGEEYNELLELKTHEVSFVDFPANPETRITAVKSAECNCKQQKQANPEIITSLKEINQGIVNSIKKIKE